MTTPLHTLELTLWHPETRYDRALMDATFAPDFHEFGRSGRRHTRAELLDAEAHDFSATLHDFIEHPLSATITLTTYTSELRTPTAPNGPTAPRSGTAPRAAGNSASTKAHPRRVGFRREFCLGKNHATPPSPPKTFPPG